jgi:hypothetical protein
MAKNKLKKYTVDATSIGGKKVKIEARNAHDAIAKVIAAKYKAKTTTPKSEKKLLIHRHKYGTSTAVCEAVGFKGKDFLLNEEQAIKLAKLCGLDFEPDKGEELDIVDLDTEDVTTITREQLYGK